MALVDPVAALEGRAPVVATTRLAGPIVRLAYDAQTGWLAAADGKRRAVYRFSVADLLEDPAGLAPEATPVVFRPRDMFAANGVVYVVNDDALFVLPAAGEVQRCEGIHAGAVAGLPAELLAGGLFVTAEGNRVENYVTSEGDACPARRAIGTPSLRLRRLTTFVGME